MSIKKSVFAGPAVERLLASNDLSGEQLAMDLNISSQHGSNIKNNRRTMQADIAQESITLYDNPEYTMDILYEFSGGLTSPVLRGKNIEQHRLAFSANAERELTEGLEMIKKICLAKPPSSLDSSERENVKNLMDELLDARIHIDNLLMQIQVEYKLSIKERIKSLLPQWKMKGWLA
jgi:transcriptional regulator with XRE-family HTH domain